MNDIYIAIIGGSGLYNINGLINEKWVSITSDFGNASDQIPTGEILGNKIAFLPRHGRG